MSPFSPYEGIQVEEQKDDEWDMVVNDLLSSLDETSNEPRADTIKEYAIPMESEVNCPSPSISLTCSNAEDWLSIDLTDVEMKEVDTTDHSQDTPDKTQGTPEPISDLTEPGPSTSSSQLPRPQRKGKHQPRTKKRKIYFPDGSWKRIPERLLLSQRGKSDNGP